MNDRLTEIEARLNAATPGEWVRINEGVGIVPGGNVVQFLARDIAVKNAEMIANAPADLRYLLERVRELEAQLHETRIALRFAQIYAENALEYATDQTMIARHGTTGRLESHD